MSRAREFPEPFEFEDAGEDTPVWRPLGVRRERTFGPYGVLMAAAPFEPVDDSQAELLELREVLADAIDSLPEKDRFVIEALWIERRSFRDLARDMSCGVASVMRTKNRAVKTLQAALQDNALIKERLND